MKSKNPIALIIAWLGLAASPAQTVLGADETRAAQQTGSITGRVQNVVTGQYLNRARVSVKSTDHIVFTDEFGSFRLVNLPSGPLVLEIFYTDLDPQVISLDLPAGQSIERDIGLTSKARYGADGKIVTLDPFVVGSNKETDTQAIATNEQRFAPNIKNVVATDSMGDVLGSSAGDFLKYVPGLTADYDNADVTAISVRGMGGALTTFQTDGAGVVSGNIGSSRTVEMRTLALNNISRIDVTKVPTPATPADSLGGAINMISKNAFERSGAEFRYGLSLVGNAPENVTFRKTPHPNGDKKTRKLMPGFDFDYTQPIGKNFGFVLTGMQSNKFNEQHISSQTWNGAGTATGATLATPFLQQFAVNDVPRSESRTIFSGKADWRITPKSVLSVGGRWSRYKGFTGSLNVTAIAGTIGTSTIAGGMPFSYSPEFTIGATGRGGVNLVGGGQYFIEDSFGTNLNYRFDDGKWRVNAGVNYAGSERERDNTGNGHFLNVTAVINQPVRVSLLDINEDRPGRIQVFSNTNQEIDIYNIDNFRMSAASDNPQIQEADYRAGNLDVRRRLDVFSFPTAIEVGGLHRIQTLDARRESNAWTYTGTDATARQYMNDVYVNQEAHLGFKNFQGISANKAYAAHLANPNLFTQTPAQVVASETFRRTNSEYIEEAVTAAYFQAEARLLKNRLNVVTGVRFEHTSSNGLGLLNDPNAVFVRNPDGTFARNAQGARIRKPEAGAANSIQQLQLTHTERGARAKRSYEGYYPSLHLNYNVTEKFITRVAYARTYGRPNFNEVIPNATINEADLGEDELDNPNIPHGTITVRNTGLKPWTADNYDLSLEYYTDQGGIFSGGVFLKEIRDFFGNQVKIATAEDLELVGLDARYVGWNLTTKFNSGDARITGVEFNIRHSLRRLGGWGRYFTVFANATKLNLKGNPYASFTSFIPKTANWGVSYSWRRVSIMTKWNYRGLNQLTPLPALGPDGFLYLKARTTLDMNVGYQFTKRLSFVASANNVFNVVPLTQLRYGSETPKHARRSTTSEYGVAFAVGIKGSF